MACENLATKADIQAILAAIQASESRILSELDIKFRAVSLQISQATTTIIGKSQEILNEVLRLRGKLDEINANILVVIPIVNNIVGILVSLKGELRVNFLITNQLINNVKLAVDNAINLINQIEAELNFVKTLIEGVSVEVNQVYSVALSTQSTVQTSVSLSRETLNISSETLSQTTSIQGNFQTINNRLDVLNQVTQGASNSLNILVPSLPRVGGGGGLVLDILIPRINNILDTIATLIDIINDLQGGGGGGCPELLETEIGLKTIECIDCENVPPGEPPCSEEERGSGAREENITVTGVPNALVEIDDKLSKILKKDCEEETEDILFCQTVVVEEPVKNKVYYGSEDRETIVFAGWVKFFRDVKDLNGNDVRLELGVESPIRRLVEFFPLPTGATGYYVQPLHNAQIEHSLVRVRNGKIVSGLIV